MKVITVAEAEGRLAEIIYKVMNGEGIVLKDGDREVCLTPGTTLNSTWMRTARN